MKRRFLLFIWCIPCIIITIPLIWLLIQYNTSLTILFDISHINGDVCTISHDCHNGICWFGTCLCLSGWYGTTCNNTLHDTCVIDSDCSHGTTTTGFCYVGNCECFSNYYGSHCQYERRDISYCIVGAINETLYCNDGVCIENELGFGECWCPFNTTLNYCCTVSSISPFCP